MQHLTFCKYAKLEIIFQYFNLKVNDEKTEETIIKREQGKTEKWKWTIELGSLIGDYKD